MFDLKGFLGLLDEAEQRRRKPIAAQSGRPWAGSRPWTGPTPQPTPFDDEVRRRPGSGSGGRRATPGGIGQRGQRGAGTGETVLSEMPVLFRQSIARGSQPAVVKLVSFAAGRTRVTKLLGYQSRNGEIPVENEAGETIEGRDWITAIANAWAEEDGRKPSRDVLRLSLSLASGSALSNETVGNALMGGLPGHRIAWQSVEGGDGEGRRVELVISAARRRQEGEKRAGRIFDTRKSLGAVEGQLKSAFGAETRVEMHGFSHGVEGVARALGQLQKGGHAIIAVRMDGSGAFVGQHEVGGGRSILDEARDWKRDLRSQQRRDVAHIVLSAKPGTPKEAFVGAARAMLASEFAGHRFLFTLHEDRNHLHVHAVVKMVSETGRRLHPKIEDLRRWRAVLAQEARERNIPMDAVSRFERANPPAYKMKDIRRVERGEASEALRRRVEAVRQQAVHVPTRPEGLRHAMSSAAGWSGQVQISEEDYVEPPQRPGTTRLYRAQRDDDQSAAPLFTVDRTAAAQIVARNGGAVRYIDVTPEQRQQIRPSRRHPETVFVVPRALAVESQVLPLTASETMHHFQQRSFDAVLNSMAAATERNSPKLWTAKEPDMADLQTMSSAFAEMETNLDTVAKNLPPERLAEFDGLRRKLKLSQTKMIEAQTAIEAKRGRIEGETWVQPVPQNFAGFVAEKRGEDVRYSQRAPEGRVGAVAFTDHGDRVEVSRSRDRETVLAALELGAEKWGAVRVSGPDRYKALAVELAAEHGFQLTNPELQDKLESARDRIARERSEQASVLPGATPTQKPADRREADGSPAQAARDDQGQRSDRPDASQALPSAVEKRQKREGKPIEPEPRAEAPAAGANGSDGQKAPVDSGDKVKPADRDRQSIVEAMRVASEKWGVVAVNGSEREKAIAVELAAEHGFKLSNPELQEKLTAARAKIEDRQDKERARERKQLGFVDGADTPAVRRTDAEIAVALEAVKEKTEAEAARAVKQAKRTAKSGERPFDGGGDDHAYRTKAEASAAVRAEKAVEQNPTKPIPADVSQSPEIERQRLDQKELLEEKDANRQTQVRKQKPRQRH